jgi:Uma2 family endonuclease
MALYARFGFPEYCIVDPDEPRMDACTLLNQTYVPIEQGEAGQLRSRSFLGLVLDINGLPD